MLSRQKQAVAATVVPIRNNLVLFVVEFSVNQSST